MALKDGVQTDRNSGKILVREPSYRPVDWTNTGRGQIVNMSAALSHIAELRARVTELEETLISRERGMQSLRLSYEELKLKHSASATFDANERVIGSEVAAGEVVALTQQAAFVAKENERLRGELQRLKALTEALQVQISDSNRHTSEVDSELVALRNTLQLSHQRIRSLEDELASSKTGNSNFDGAGPGLESAPGTASHAQPQVEAGAGAAANIHGLLQGDSEDQAFGAQCQRELDIIRSAEAAIESVSKADLDLWDRSLLAVAQPIRRIRPSDHLERCETWNAVQSELDVLRKKVIRRAVEKLGLSILSPVPMASRFNPSQHEESPSHRLAPPPNRPELAGVIFEVINPGLRVGEEVLVKAYVKRYAA